MNLRLYGLFLFLILTISACMENSNPVSRPVEVPPLTPFSDTPSPAQLDALLVEAPAIITLDMFNELDGWAVTQAEIARTNDGGLTWYNFTPPDMAETGYSVDAFVLDNEHAWVQKPDFDNFPNGGTMYRTDDGGRTWEDYTVPFSRGNLNFVDPENGWVMADLGVGAGSNAVAIFRTTDGGATWVRTYTNDPDDPDAADSLPLGGTKSDLIPMDRDTAWVTGVVYAPGEVYLYRTDNGGRSWAPVTVELPLGAEAFELDIDSDKMKFVSASDGFLALRMSGDSIQTAIYVTRDSGNTWRLTPNIINGAGASSFLTGQDAVIYDGEQFHVTRDAAQSWVVIHPDVSFGETLVDMEFVNPMTGWVITMDPSTNHRSLYRTQDGGSTWLPVVP